MPKRSSPQKLKPSRHFNHFWNYRGQASDTSTDHCPYCQGREVVKRGRRQKKHETVQLYLCKSCEKTFTQQSVKGKHYPLKIILDGVSLYNRGYTQSQACRLIKEKYGPNIKLLTLSNCIQELEPLCRYAHFRERATDLCSPHQVVKPAVLHHQQVYTKLTLKALPLIPQ